MSESNEAAAHAAKRGFTMPKGYVLVHTATVLRDGWEMDNRIWVIDGPSGRFLASTNHGGLRVPCNEDLKYLIKEHESALESLRTAERLMLGAQGATPNG